MARYGGAQWRPIPVNYSHGGIAPDLLIVHIMQGSLAGTDSWFRNPAAQASAHFGVGSDGTVYQWVDTSDMAWHAMSANPRAIGVEHEGYSGSPLTAAQLDATARIYAWAAKAHGIPLHLASGEYGTGLAWHGLGGTDWGGHLNCPGSPVVAQLPAMLATAEAGTQEPAPVTQEDPVLLNKGANAVTPFTLSDSARQIRFASAAPATLAINTGVTGKPMIDVNVPAIPATGWANVEGLQGVVIHRVDGGTNDVSALEISG